MKGRRATASVGYLIHLRLLILGAAPASPTQITPDDDTKEDNPTVLLTRDNTGILEGDNASTVLRGHADLG
jgi:hypothetical protein